MCRQWDDSPSHPVWPVTLAPGESGPRLDSAAHTLRPGLFFYRRQFFLRHSLLLGVASQIAIGWPVRPDVMALTKVPHGRPLHRDARGLIHIRRQFFVGPVRAIKPTPRRAGFHPCLDRRPQRLGNPPRLARCPVDLQALHAPFVIVLEPEPYRGTMHPQILRDGLALSPPARHQDRLTPVTEASVIGRLEDVFQVLLFHCRQLNPPHLCQPPLLRNLTRGYLRKDAMSSGACIRRTWQGSTGHGGMRNWISVRSNRPCRWTCCGARRRRWCGRRSGAICWSTTSSVRRWPKPPWGTGS